MTYATTCGCRGFVICDGVFRYHMVDAKSVSQNPSYSALELLVVIEALQIYIMIKMEEMTLWDEIIEKLEYFYNEKSYKKSIYC